MKYCNLYRQLNGYKNEHLIQINKMAKLIAAINMTLDGFCDHTAGIPDEELHQHYAELLSNADTLLYGRITYQLMEYWKPIVEQPTGNKAMDAFAVIINKVPKIVFSHTLKSIDWDSARLANSEIEEEVLQLKQSGDDNGKDIYIGSRSLIIHLMKCNLIDELQLCIHPVLIGNGLPLFENINERATLKLVKTKIFHSGAIILYYKPSGE